MTTDERRCCPYCGALTTDDTRRITLECDACRDTIDAHGSRSWVLRFFTGQLSLALSVKFGWLCIVLGIACHAWGVVELRRNYRVIEEVRGVRTNW